MANRKSGKELRKEYNDILDKTKALENRIINRAKKLIMVEMMRFMGKLLISYPLKSVMDYY